MKHNKIKTSLVGAAVGFINGFFASGGGIVAVLALKKLLGIDEKKSHATAISIILPLTLSTLIIYSKNGFVNMPLILKASGGGIPGAIIGAKLLAGLPKEYIKLGFGIVMIAAAVRMFFR